MSKLFLPPLHKERYRKNISAKGTKLARLVKEMDVKRSHSNLINWLKPDIHLTLERWGGGERGCSLIDVREEILKIIKKSIDNLNVILKRKAKQTPGFNRT